MKKVLAIAFIAATIVACNNKSKTETPKVDSVALKATADSLAAAAAAAAANATATGDSLMKAATDSLTK